MSNKRVYILMLAVLVAKFSHAQYAPQAGTPGSTAIYKDSSALVAWATGCQLNLGWQHIADTTLGKTSVGNSEAAVGTANGSIVSLGDGGVATLTFGKPIINGAGFDFAVFENGFTTSPGNAFLELAFVEVSSDGLNFVRFAATSNIPDSVQLAMEGVDCSLLNNLAGKYVANYGTPFDLEELASEPNLDVNNITHVRITDVVGSIDPLYASYDSQGHKVNDPYPTPFASSGFDLDAVGVINEKQETGITDAGTLAVSVYPNPAKDMVHIYLEGSAEITLADMMGKICHQTSNINNQSIDVSELNTGLYILQITGGGRTHTTKLLVE